MQGDFPAFCHRQSTKMIKYAEDSADPVLKGKFLQMSASWLKQTSQPNRPPQQFRLDGASE